MQYLTPAIPPPAKIHGGKYYLRRRIVTELSQDHFDYVEPCGGMASVGLNKEYSLGKEYYNDIDPLNYLLFVALKQEGDWLLSYLRDQVAYNEATFINARTHTDYHASLGRRLLSMDDLAGQNLPCNATGVLRLVASQFLISSRMSRGGLGQDFSWTPETTRLRGGQQAETNSWQNFVTVHLPRIIHRVSAWEISCFDVLHLLEALAQQVEFLFYIDPPYLIDTRRTGGVYRHEWGRAEHIRLLELCRPAKCKIAISAYRSPMYDEMLTAAAGWRNVQWEMANHSGQTAVKQRRIEVLYMNYGSNVTPEMAQSAAADDSGEQAADVEEVAPF